MFALAREAGELPDQDLLEGSVLGLGLVQHPSELGPVGDAPTLGLVDELAHDAVAMALGVVAQRAELGSDGKIDILTVRGDSSVECGWDGVGKGIHVVLLSRATDDRAPRSTFETAYSEWTVLGQPRRHNPELSYKRPCRD